MSTELDKILAFAASYLGSSFWHGRCQSFVAHCYYAGMGRMVSRVGAKQAAREFMRAGTARDLYPPTGAVAYFNGDGEMGKKYGHAALSAGGGWIYDPVGTVIKRKLTAGIHNGYLGWGWNGNLVPQGASSGSGGSAGGTAGKTASGGSSSGGAKQPGIVTVNTVGVAGKISARRDDGSVRGMSTDALSVLIKHGADLICPCVVGTLKVSSFAGIVPAVMEFYMIGDTEGAVADGDAAAFSWQGEPLFYGYVFEVTRRHDGMTRVKCYDQMRYLKNRDSFVFGGTLTALVGQIAKKYSLRTGPIASTGYALPRAVYENTLADILARAISATREQTGKTYALYDDFGRLTLKNADEMRADVFLTPDRMRSYRVESSIDSGVYNRIAAASDDRKTGVRTLYTADAPAQEAEWGVLQYYTKLDKTRQPAQTVKKLLDVYNHERVFVYAYGCAGVPSVRGGSIVKFAEAGDFGFDMRCESVTHAFFGGTHLMDVKLSAAARRTVE